MKLFSYLCFIMADSLFLIDGHALIFKMYYAFARRPMINSKGADMSILYGFTKYLLELMEREDPAYLAVAFDPPGGTFRNEMYAEYKANRAETPQLVIDALEPLQELCGALNIPILMVRGFEADDVIGTVAKRTAREGLDVYMVTPDKDYGQLVEPHILQYKPGKGGSEHEVLGPEEICAKYGLRSPGQVVEMLTLCGDTADNVPGVKGVGEVGAAKLLARYDTVEDIYAHLDELPDRQKAMFEEARGHIALSHDLVTIKTDVPVDIETEAMRVDKAYGPQAADLFEKYEFNSLKRYIAHAAPAPQRTETEVSYKEVYAKEVCEAARKAGRCALVAEAVGSGISARAGRLTVAAPGDGTPVAAADAEDFRALLEDGSVTKVGNDLKRLTNLLAAREIRLEGPLHDIALMHYLIDPEKSHDAGVLSRSYLDVSLEETEGEAVTGSLFGEESEDAAPSSGNGREAAVLLALGRKIREDLEKNSLAKLYDEMEEPLLKVLARMEREGVKMDLGSLGAFTEMLRDEIATREDRVRRLGDEPELNVSSPKQIGALLFEKLKLSSRPKKNANGTYSTDETTLLDIADRHPIVDEILEFRAAKKLLSTYIEPIPGYIDPSDGKIHTTFNQALTATGRLSSSNPNLQNIPIRTERGREIRRAFVSARKDGRIVSADYSQIELRIMAHLSCDAHLIDAFRRGIDIHSATAAKIFGIPHEEVSPEQRRIAKTANFGILYGISAFGLAQRLRIGRRDAQQIIDDYFASFPSIRSYIEDTKAAARETGYVETVFGRRRYLPDINSRNATLRALAERNAVNAPIQGTAADIIKLAMIRVQQSLDEKGLQSRMVLQIHDELLFDAPPEETEVLKETVIAGMEGVVKLSVPLTVECNDGKNWLEAH